MNTSPKRPASLKTCVVVLLSCICPLWTTRLHLEDFLSPFSEKAGDGTPPNGTMDSHLYTLTPSNFTNETSVDHDTTISTQENFLTSNIETVPNTNNLDNSTKQNSSIPENWIPSHRWIQDCVQREQKNPVNYKKKYRSRWPHYQLGDCLKLCKSCASSMRQSQVKDLSIVGHYWKNVCHKKDFSETFNITFLTQLFEMFEANPYPYSKPWPQPASDELVIHLRIGDVIDESRYSGKNTTVYAMLRHGADTRHGANSFYEKGIKSVEEYLSTIRESGLTKVVLRGGSHFPKIYPKSRIYTKCLTDAIEQAGYTISSAQVDGEDNPDQDFFYMSHAKHFVQATGGYSRLIAHMVQHYGGTIVGRVPGASAKE